MLFVPAVGLITVALKPSPLTVTPAGTTSGNISVNVPAPSLITSPEVATDNACAKVRNALSILVPSSVSLPLTVTW